MSDFIVIEKNGKKFRKCLVCGKEVETSGRVSAKKHSEKTCGQDFYKKNEIGKVYGDIKVTDIVKEKTGKIKAKTICLICGLENDIRLENMKNDVYNNQSHENCKKIVFKNHKHEIKKFQTFKERWRMMLRRCLQNTHKSYEAYKDRAPDERWMDFMFFYNDMYKTFEPELQLDRTDNQKGYSRDNCKWVTSKENCLNRSTTRIAYCIKESTSEIIELGKEKSIHEFCDEIGVSSTSVYDKLNNKLISKTIKGYTFYNTKEECRDHLLGKYGKVPTK